MTSKVMTMARELGLHAGVPVFRLYKLYGRFRKSWSTYVSQMYSNPQSSWRAVRMLGVAFFDVWHPWLALRPSRAPSEITLHFVVNNNKTDRFKFLASIVPHK